MVENDDEDPMRVTSTSEEAESVNKSYVAHSFRPVNRNISTIDVS